MVFPVFIDKWVTFRGRWSVRSWRDDQVRSLARLLYSHDNEGGGGGGGGYGCFRHVSGSIQKTGLWFLYVCGPAKWNLSN